MAARRVDAHVRARETMRQRREVSRLGRRDVSESLDSRELFKLTEGETLTEVRMSKNVLGTNVEKLLESYKGVPVYDGVITVRANEDGNLTGDAVGTLIQDIDKDLPDLDAVLIDDETLQIAIESEGDNMTRADIGDVDFKRWIYIDKEDNDKARLVNSVSYLIDSVKRPFYVIDVKNGEVIKHWDGLNSLTCDNGGRKYKAVGGNEKMGMLKYGKCPYCLNPKYSKDGETCILENKYVRVVDMKGTTIETITDTASFPCKMGYNDSINGAYSPAIDAFFYGTVVAKMYDRWFDTTPLKDKIVLRVHYGDMYENAFWNGHNCTFGDGNTTIYPPVTIEVVSHEIAHGVSEQACGLMYFSEAGGINEAFSDIMGLAAEEFLLTGDYLVMKNIMKTLPYDREFETPENDNNSIGHASHMNSSIDPHYSSGVFRRAFYIITKEEGVSIRDAAHVFFYANRMYWNHFPSFYDSACGVVLSAMDLGINRGPFIKAFKDVGIKPCNIEKHNVYLSNGRTQYDVTVSDTINPGFKFMLPYFVDKVTVEAWNLTTGMDIVVYSDENYGVLGDELASGNGLVQIKNLESTSYNLYIQLSTINLAVYKHVNVKATSKCVDSIEYESDDADVNDFIYHYC